MIYIYRAQLMISRKKRKSSSNCSKRHYLALFIIFWLNFGYFQDLVGTLQGGCFFHLLHPQNFDHDRSAWTSSCRWTSSWNHHSGKKNIKKFVFFSKTIFINFVFIFRSNPSLRAPNMPTMSICPNWSTTWKWSFTKKSLGLPALKILFPQGYPSAPCFSVILRDFHYTISQILNFTNSQFYEFSKEPDFLV